MSKGFPGQFNVAFMQMYRNHLYVLQKVRIAQLVEFLTDSDLLFYHHTLQVRILQCTFFFFLCVVLVIYLF